MTPSTWPEMRREFLISALRSVTVKSYSRLALVLRKGKIKFFR
jgi:hypothetical protein